MRDNSDMQIQSNDNEIDLVEIIQKLWRNRRLILKVTLVFAVLGLLIAIFTPKEYTAGCTMVPQTNEKNMGGSLGGLAAMAGINLGNMGGSEVLSPKIYPKILSSTPFQKELIYTPIKFEEFEHPITLFDYYMNDEYRKTSVLGAIKKYTIGLPGVIIGAIRGEQPEPEYAVNGITQSSIHVLTREEKKCIDILKDKVSLNVNSKDGDIELETRMPEAYAAAQLAETVQLLLQKYITEFKVEKVQSNLDFVQGRYNEVKADFEQLQVERAVFRDANKNISSAKAQTEQDRLETSYNLAQSVYTELAKQLEQTKIQVKETTPILTIVDPVTLPMERSKPKRAMILVIFTFLGGILGVILVLILPFLANFTNSEKVKKMLVE